MLAEVLADEDWTEVGFEFVELVNLIDVVEAVLEMFDVVSELALEVVVKPGQVDRGAGVVLGDMAELEIPGPAAGSLGGTLFDAAGLGMEVAGEGWRGRLGDADIVGCVQAEDGIDGALGGLAGRVVLVFEKMDFVDASDEAGEAVLDEPLADSLVIVFVKRSGRVRAVVQGLGDTPVFTVHRDAVRGLAAADDIDEQVDDRGLESGDVRQVLRLASMSTLAFEDTQYVRKTQAMLVAAQPSRFASNRHDQTMSFDQLYLLRPTCLPSAYAIAELLPCLKREGICAY